MSKSSLASSMPLRPGKPESRSRMQRGRDGTRDQGFPEIQKPLRKDGLAKMPLRPLDELHSRTASTGRGRDAGRRKGCLVGGARRRRASLDQFPIREEASPPPPFAGANRLFQRRYGQSDKELVLKDVCEYSVSASVGDASQEIEESEGSTNIFGEPSENKRRRHEAPDFIAHTSSATKDWTQTRSTESLNRTEKHTIPKEGRPGWRAISYRAGTFFSSETTRYRKSSTPARIDPPGRRLSRHLVQKIPRDTKGGEGDTRIPPQTPRKPRPVLGKNERSDQPFSGQGGRRHKQRPPFVAGQNTRGSPISRRTLFG